MSEQNVVGQPVSERVKQLEGMVKQLEVLADAAEHFAAGSLHVTARDENGKVLAVFAYATEDDAVDLLEYLELEATRT